MEAKSTFADRLALAMREKDVTEAQVSQAAGVSQQAVSNWKRGENSSKKIHLVAKFLGVRVEWLMKGEGPMTDEKEDEFIALLRKVDDPEMKQRIKDYVLGLMLEQK